MPISPAHARADCGDLAIDTVAVAAYDLALARPWHTARGRRERRVGWLLRLRTRDGASGFGECAPLPEAGTETEAKAHATLRALLPRLRGLTADSALEQLGRLRDVPAVRCAVESAVLDLAARAGGVPLAAWLEPGAADRVAVNAAIGALDPGTRERSERAIDAGFRVLKLKLGLGPAAAELAGLIELARGLPSGVALRLDVNGAWDAATARLAIEALGPLPVESLEEPLGDPDPDALRRLQAISPWPIALDESLARWPLADLLDDPPTRRIVLKPMVVGGASAACDIASRARAAGVEIVVTTTVDGAIGTALALHTAAAIDGEGEAVHGLATSAWLREDIGESPPVENGYLFTGQRPGLGTTPYARFAFEDVGRV